MVVSCVDEAVCVLAAAQEALQQMLLLILGCAVQCDQKEKFIDDIKRLDIYTQQAIVDYIKQVSFVS